MNKILFFILFLYAFGCDNQSGVPLGQNAANQEVTHKTNSSNIKTEATTSSKNQENFSGEIASCLPKKLNRNSKLVVSLKNPNGGFLAVKREAEKPDYFLLSDLENSKLYKFAASADALPFWTTETLKTLTRIEMNSAKARTINLSKLDNQGEGKAELIFSQTGWYEILLSDETFEQTDPVITGRCRVFYDASATEVKEVSAGNSSANSEIIEWKSETKNLTFETRLTIKNGQPTAFSLTGWQITGKEGEKSANECYFEVEKGKNNTVWQTSKNKTTISGKTDLGTDLKMFIQKNSNGFLIDTSSAAESCMNVGVSGNILLTKVGNKYVGRFIK